MGQVNQVIEWEKTSSCQSSEPEDVKKI